MITLEQTEEQLREVNDLWMAVVVARRKAVEAERAWKKMMREYYGQRSESDGIDEGAEVETGTVAE